MRHLAPLVPNDDPPDLVVLVRLQVLNTVLIASALRDTPDGPSTPARIIHGTLVLIGRVAAARLR
jgi:hypothetical protein